MTIPDADFIPELPASCNWIKGQLEKAASGFLHWQLVLSTKKKVRVTALKKIFPRAHIEPTRSAAAEAYVWKEDTSVAGTRFEFGSKLLKRNDPKDWEAVRGMARAGRLEDIDPDIYIRSYFQLQRIAVDHAKPVGMERECVVYWGTTGLGKSRRAWHECGLSAYPKDPNTKFWDGYKDHEHVVCDEFRGVINISNLLRWCDRYPVLVEIKGSSRVLCAKKIIFTSNIHPREWYVGLDNATIDALLRRLVIVEFTEPWVPRDDSQHSQYSNANQ
nr:MAG: replication associated protein [Cressdnaviricota sp.]